VLIVFCGLYWRRTSTADSKIDLSVGRVLKPAYSKKKKRLLLQETWRAGYWLDELLAMIYFGI
jgi:hypothetical protein